MTSQQCCQVPKLFWPVHQKSSASLGKVRPSSQKHQCRVLPLFYHFWERLAKFIFFSRPLLSFLAGISATWQHCVTAGGMVGLGGPSALHTEFFQNHRGTRNCMTFGHESLVKGTVSPDTCASLGP